MAGTGSDAAFAYHEPTIEVLLNLTGFLLVLNIVNTCLDKLLYCGLVGQLFVGILWGTPGTKWLDQETETVIQQLGYLGLIMLVYEGGLSTSIKSVRANLIVSLRVAFTGIGTPMALSFILTELVSASPLQSFAAGAALSATSLGTTFTILSTTNLIATRLGTVTTSAAMLDDVVGLVMVQIISNLGGNASSFSAVTVIRPVFVSLGFALGLFLLCAFFLKPILRKMLAMNDKMPRFIGTLQFAFLAQTCVLVGIVAGATYAGTSSLFAAYLAGVIISWFDGLAADFKAATSTRPSNISQTSSDVSNEQSSNSYESIRQNCPQSADSSTAPTSQETSLQIEGLTGEKVYEKYYKAPVNRILIPLFFASIGFAIPITEMFQGSVVWRGVIYAILMAFAKMVTGLWLVRFPLSRVPNLISILKKPFSYIVFFCTVPKSEKRAQKKKPTFPEERSRSTNQATAGSLQRNNSERADKQVKNKGSSGGNPSQLEPSPIPRGSPSNPNTTNSHPPKPKSLYPPSILGLAMVARGEVGYLIASLAESQGMFSSGSNEKVSEIYLVIIWAISICTLVGPISVGTLVKRVKKLQQSRENSGADPLGAWGI